MDGSDEFDDAYPDDFEDSDPQDPLSADACEANSPEDDIRVARGALSEGDLAHAAFHVACALADNPLREDWKALLAAIAGKDDDPESLLSVDEEEVYLGVVAGQAFILEQSGKLSDALILIGEAIEYDPRIPYATWVTEWLLRAERSDLNDALDSDALTAFLHALLRSGALEELDESQTLSFCRAFQLISDQTPRATEDFEYARCAILRRMGEFEKALETAEAMMEIAPSWRSAICVAMVHRESGNVEKALEAYRRAAAFEPSEVSTYLDMGDVLLGEGKYSEAAVEYDKACIIEDESPWAYPSFLYCRYFAEEQSVVAEEILQELESYVSAHPDNGRAADLLEHVQRLRERPYKEYLPEPHEALIQVVRQLIDDGKSIDDASIDIGLSYLEAPSAVSACRKAFALAGDEGADELVVSVSTIQSPDPRQCPEDSVACLWHYEGVEAAPAVDPPRSDAVIAAVTEIAESPYHLHAWWQDACQLASRLTKDHVSDLLACMVHPPESRADFVPWIWLQHVQIAAAMLLAQIERRDWSSSTLENSLLALCHGTKDWTVCAAIIALTRLVTDEASQTGLQQDVREAFESLERSMPDAGFCCYAHCLTSHLLELPGLAPEESERLQVLLNELEASGEDS